MKTFSSSLISAKALITSIATLAVLMLLSTPMISMASADEINNPKARTQTVDSAHYIPLTPQKQLKTSVDEVSPEIVNFMSTDMDEAFSITLVQAREAVSKAFPTQSCTVSQMLLMDHGQVSHPYWIVRIGSDEYVIDDKTGTITQPKYTTMGYAGRVRATGYGVVTDWRPHQTVNFYLGGTWLPIKGGVLNNYRSGIILNRWDRSMAFYWWPGIYLGRYEAWPETPEFWGWSNVNGTTNHVGLLISSMWWQYMRCDYSAWDIAKEFELAWW